jgi:transcriptional regulator with XRE-family HTH domain
MSGALAKIRPSMRGSEGQTEPIGVRLRRLRLERGLSQRDLSSPGVSYAYISRIEAGARTPSVKALRMLAQKLGVSVEYLETGREIGEGEARELKLGDAELALRLGGDTTATEQTLREVLEEARRAGDTVAASRAATGLGFAAALRGSHLDAVERLEEALKDFPVAPHIRPDVYATLGQSYAALGAPERAARLFRDVLGQLAEATPSDANVQVRFAALLSYALTDAGDHEEARTIVRETLDRVGGETNPQNRIRLYWSLARVATHEGRLGEAVTYIRRAIALLEVTDDTMQLARGYLLSAGLEARDGKTEKVRADLSRAQELLGPSPEPRDLGTLRIGQSWLAGLEGESGAAVERAREALEVLGPHYGAEQAMAVWALGRGLGLEGDVTGADDAFRRAVDLLTVHGRRHDAARAAAEWADMLRKAGRNEDAAKASERAAALGADLEAETTRAR